MRLCLKCALLLSLAAGAWRTSLGQAVLPVPYDAQLRSDPAVGNVQGIQRYGRPLRTDPDQGEGYSYHVYPVAHSSADEKRAEAGAAILAILQERQSAAAAEMVAPGAASAAPAEMSGPHAGPPPEKQAGQGENLQASGAPRMSAQDTQLLWLAEALLAGSAESPYGAPYRAPFDATAGLRNYSSPRGVPGEFNELVRNAEAAGLPPQVLTQAASLAPFQAASAELQAAALGVGSVVNGVAQLTTLYNQPLIQIKLRVVEVVRDDTLQVNSVLNYISENPNSAQPAYFTTNNVNGGKRNLTSLMQFPAGGVMTVPFSGTGIGSVTTGVGSLVNLTSTHINAIASILATEFNGDLITAPEVVTLNGQNVEFVAGAKLPFQIGQSVVVGDSNNIQQFFYKHVGTYVSVTPKIINFGYQGEGQGEAPIVAADVFDWNALITSMLAGDVLKVDPSSIETLKTYSDNNLVVPFAVKTIVLNELNKYQRSHFVAMYNNEPTLRLAGLDFAHYMEECNGVADWKPENSTVELSVVVRLSQPGASSQNVTVGGGADNTITATTEENVRAVANVIQVQSGNGVVMAGLIGDRETAEQAKAPILGDLPIVGFLFRSKRTSRNKTEILVFVEAKVLPAEPNAARATTYEDYVLGQPYVQGEFLDNPLELGMYRVGFGTYLPPWAPGEGLFWARMGREVRKVRTHIGDTLQP